MESADDGTNDWTKTSMAFDLDQHNDYPHDFLTDFFGQCIRGDSDDVRVLVPMCINSAVDMKWLYDEGYRVYGVDSSEKALQAFFKKYDMKYMHTPSISEGFGIFKNEDERIKLFCGDFFRFSKTVSGCGFDVIWDRSAFMTVNSTDREKYFNVVKDILLPTGRILLATFVYDSTKWRGPPYSVQCQEIHRCFDQNFHVNTLRTHDIVNPWYRECWGIDWLKEVGYMLSLKT